MTVGHKQPVCVKRVSLGGRLSDYYDDVMGSAAKNLLNGVAHIERTLRTTVVRLTFVNN